jgi:hypothetical protein
VRSYPSGLNWVSSKAICLRSTPLDWLESMGRMKLYEGDQAVVDVNIRQKNWF